jgi:rSAM/selenodomain-associated transferase 2
MKLSVIVPALDEAAAIAATLAPLQAWRAAGHEVLLVDGGSRDGTPELAAALVDRTIVTAPGRARQMNAGALAATGDGLLFLHADTQLPADAERSIVAAFAAGRVWGRFDVRLSGRQPLLRVVERLMNWRSRLTGIATGDQAIFVRRGDFAAVGGFPDIPLMEDVALSRALRRRGRPVCLRGPAVTSSRRWEANGVLRTVLLMWRLRLAYFLGANPAALARRYRRDGKRSGADA